MKNMRSLTLFVFVLSSFLFPSFESVQAADYTVVMGPTALAFNPASLTINQGDTVTWTNAAAALHHTSTSGSPPGIPDGLWDSGTLIQSGTRTFTMTFSNFVPRTYPYFCGFHFGFGMVGSLTITNAGTVPPPSLTNALLTGSGFQFAIDGLIGQTNVTETSSDLVSWSPVSTNMALSTAFNVTNLPAVNNNGFYRVRLVP